MDVTFEMGADSTVVPPRHTKQRDSVDFELAKFRDDIEVACLEQGLLAQPSSPATTSRYSRTNLINLLRIFLRYPAPNSLTLRSTSWLDGLRGVAALEVVSTFILILSKNLGVTINPKH